MVFDWHVEFRNERSGFGRTVDVEAETHGGALAAAFVVLELRGYRADEFEVVGFRRGRIVSQGVVADGAVGG